MFCTVIPALRTPRHVGGFDYEIPDGMNLEPGDLVRIPFRKREIPGLVSEINASTEIKEPKQILGAINDIKLGELSVQLIKQLAERSFSSQPTVLHSWIGKLPKKAGTRDEGRGIRVKKIPSESQSFIPNPQSLIFSTNHLAHLVNIAKEAIGKNKRVLILSPWSERAERIAREFDTHALTSDAAMGKRFKLWDAFIGGDSLILVATRIGAWCGISADLVIIDEPENDDHKQDELAPRYDARWIVAYLQSKGIETISVGLTPKLTHVHQSSITDIPTIEGDIRYIDTHYSDWSDIPGVQGRTSLILEDAAKQERPIFIIHPIYGEQARLRCKDCGWIAACDRCGGGMTVQKNSLYCRRCQFKKETALECPSCGSVQFANSKPGTIKITNAIARSDIRTARVLTINEWNALEDIPNHSLVIMTDLNLLAGTREDLRKTEQLIIAWRRLADICIAHQSTLIVQSDAETLTRAKDWLDGPKCLKALQNEIEDRKTFHLPPTSRLIKLIFRGNQGHASRVLDILKHEAERLHGTEISGPFEVRFRPTHREPRWIGQWLVPLDIPLQEAIRALQPIADQTDTLIDLDPIAFFE